MALTATATLTTQKSVCETLGMIDPVVISVTPNRPNIHYTVVLKTASIEETFSPMVEEVRLQRLHTPRAVVFCRSYEDVAYLYSFFNDSLGKEATEPIGAPHLSQFRLVEMFSAWTETSVKILFLLILLTLTLH